MKLLIVLLFMMAATISSLPLPDEWDSYKVKHNKTYDDPADETIHKEIFFKNKQMIEEHNKKYDDGLVSYKLGINQFSDMTDAEFQLMTGLARPSESDKNVTATSA